MKIKGSGFYDINCINETYFQVFTEWTDHSILTISIVNGKKVCYLNSGKSCQTSLKSNNTTKMFFVCFIVEKCCYRQKDGKTLNF